MKRKKKLGLKIFNIVSDAVICHSCTSSLVLLNILLLGASVNVCLLGKPYAFVPFHTLKKVMYSHIPIILCPGFLSLSETP